MKKIISLILVCMMFITVIPVTLFADTAVVEIKSAAEFAKIADNLSGNYKLTADISITEAISYKAEDKPFTGTLDGNGHTITVNLKDTESARFAIFCSVGGCTIKNLKVKGKVESTGNSTGALIGTVKGDGIVTTIENVTTDVQISATAQNGQGAIIGAVEGKATVKLIDCTNKGTINGENAGGMIGAIWSGVGGVFEITDCTNEGSITANGSAGGLIGRIYNNPTVTLNGCSNKGEIVGTNQYADYRGVGGFIGSIQSNSAKVSLKNCGNTGNVTAKYIVANAYIGHNNINDSGSYTNEGCTNTGKITTGGWKLPANVATARDHGIWGSASFSYSFDTKKVTGNPQFHNAPSVEGYTAYINGVEATSKVVVTDKQNRQLGIEFDATGADGFASVVIVWSDGQYSTFGCPTPSKSEVDTVDKSAEILAKQDEVSVDADSVTAENPLRNDGKVDPHGSEKNLFDDNKTNKYEGWKLKDSGSVIVSFKLTEAVKVGYYALGTGNDDANYPDRQLTAWKLWASVDGNDYTVIDEVSNYDFPNINNQLVAFKAETDTAYQYFKLELISFTSEATATGDCYVQLGQVKIYKACDHQWGTPVVKDPTCTKPGSSTVTCDKCGETKVTEIPANGHHYVNGVCDGCGRQENATAPETGDISIVMIVVSVMALVATAFVVSKKRSYR